MPDPTPHPAVIEAVAEAWAWAVAWWWLAILDALLPAAPRHEAEVVEAMGRLARERAG